LHFPHLEIAMLSRSIAITVMLAGIGAMSTTASAQTPARPAAPHAGMLAKAPERAIRRDIPLTNMIRRAFAAGTRDSSGRPTAKYWQIFNDYTIGARFDAPTKRVSGRETIVLHNNSDSALRTIQMRLDQNLFAPNVPRAEVVTDITDGMQVTKLIVDNIAANLNPTPQMCQGRGGRGGAAAAPTPAESPTLLCGGNLTSASIHLTNPIPAHGSATIEAEWNFKVPQSDGVRGIRMGAWGDSLYQVGQWYPRVAVYDDLRGWDTDPYLGPSEFYNNLGKYDVKIDVPAGWLVGATATLQNPQDVYTAETRGRLSHVLESDSQRAIVTADERGPGKSTMAGDRLVWHFTTDTVGDVAWATSDRFVFDATRANIPGKGEVPIYLMYEPGNAARFCTQGATGRHALEFYSRLWMPYTFPSLTQVDGPEGGMEYPMFIMAAGSTDHEIGHQWWPMMVNTNETWYGFMDEGFNNWMNTLSAADRNGGRGGRGAGGGGAAREGAGTCPPPATAGNGGRGNFAGRGGGAGPVDPYRTIAPPGGTATENGSGQSYGRTAGNEMEAPLMWDANYGGPQYSTQAYGVSGPMLSMLGGIVGDSAVWHAMSDYAKAWRFKHPSPWDYAFYMSNALHKDLGWFWYYWLFTTESVEGSIQDVKSVGTHTTVTVHQDGQMPSPVMLAVQLAAKGPAIHQMANSRMLDSNTVLVTYPVDVWFNGSKTFKADLSFGGRKIEKITLDPFGRFPDRDVRDNSWPRDTTAAPAGRGGRRGGGQ
jgi:hypothetical protein